MTQPNSLCDAVQLKLSCEDALSTEETGHVQGCPACAAHARAVPRLLDAARVPALPTAAEVVAREVRASFHRAPPARRTPWLGYLAAAFAGAVLARALAPAPALPEATAPAAAALSPAVTLAQAEPLNVAADEVSFEVEWPDGQAETELEVPEEQE